MTICTTCLRTASAQSEARAGKVTDVTGYSELPRRLRFSYSAARKKLSQFTAEAALSAGLYSWSDNYFNLARIQRGKLPTKHHNGRRKPF